MEKPESKVPLSMYSPYSKNTKNRAKKSNTIVKINPKKRTTFYLSLSVLYTYIFIRPAFGPLENGFKRTKTMCMFYCYE